MAGNLLGDLNDLLDPKPQDDEQDETSAVVTAKSTAETDQVEQGEFSRLKSGVIQEELEDKYTTVLNGFLTWKYFTTILSLSL